MTAVMTTDTQKASSVSPILFGAFIFIAVATVGALVAIPAVSKMVKSAAYVRDAPRREKQFSAADWAIRQAAAVSFQSPFALIPAIEKETPGADMDEAAVPALRKGLPKVYDTGENTNPRVMVSIHRVSAHLSEGKINLEGVIKEAIHEIAGLHGDRERPYQSKTTIVDSIESVRFSYQSQKIRHAKLEGIVAVRDAQIYSVRVLSYAPVSEVYIDRILSSVKFAPPTD